jgi:transcriptional regulator with XRE-family HTH domain
MRLKRAQSADVADEGNRIRERRLRLGVPKLELARLADVDRGTLANIEAGGHYRRESFLSVSDALSRLEEEAGIDAPPPLQVAATSEPGIVEFTVEGDFGVRVVVRGPIANVEDLEQSVARIVTSIREGQREDPDAK